MPAASERFCHLVTPGLTRRRGPALRRSLSRGRWQGAGYTVVSFLQGPVRMLPVLSAP